jgi:hypothetical protein
MNLERNTPIPECSGSLCSVQVHFPFNAPLRLHQEHSNTKFSLKGSSCSTSPPKYVHHSHMDLWGLGIPCTTWAPWISNKWYKCISNMIKGIKHMYAIDQSKLRESKTFSSLRSLQKILSSNGLVKISASWFSVLIWNTSISPFCWWSLRKWCRMSMCLVRCVQQDYPPCGLHSHYHIGVGLCSDCSQSPGRFASSKVVARNTVLRQHTRPQRWIGQWKFVS